MPNAAPEGNLSDSMQRVVAAVIRKDNRYLACRRPAHKRHGGLWEFLGGKLTGGESLGAAARRELFEELGVDVIALGQHLFSKKDPGSSFVIEFVEVAIEGEPRAKEHMEIRWVQLDELMELAWRRAMPPSLNFL